MVKELFNDKIFIIIFNTLFFLNDYIPQFPKNEMFYIEKEFYLPEKALKSQGKAFKLKLITNGQFFSHTCTTAGGTNIAQS